MRKILLAGWLGMMVMGCASLPSPEEMKKEIAGFDLPAKPSEGNAMIYVVRPSGLGGLIRFNVFLDSKEDPYEMGWTRGVQHIYFELEPGQHTIYSKAENWSQANVTVKPGDIAFLRQDPSMGFIMARGSTVNIDDIEGRYHVKKTGIGTILKEKQVAASQSLTK